MRLSGDPTSAPEWDQGLSWIAFFYGVYTAAFAAARARDDLQIAVGIELVVISVLDFLWGRARVSFGASLIGAGLAAPVIAFGSAPLFWYDVRWFSGEAFWTAMIGGAAVATPLVFMGRRILTHAVTTPKEPDPPWFQYARYALKGGLWLCVLAFRIGDFDVGTVLVYVGAALAITSLCIALPRRLSLGKGGVGKVLIFLGGSALFVTCVAGGLVGGHMSGDEAMLGVIPSIVLIVVGSWLSFRSPAKN